LSLERILQALTNLGLSSIEAEIYIYLAKKGSMKAIALASGLNHSKNQIYSSLKVLTIKGLVTKRGTLFSALPFEEALELLIELEKEQAQVLNESKEKLLASWETKNQ